METSVHRIPRLSEQRKEPGYKVDLFVQCAVYSIIVSYHLMHYKLLYYTQSCLINELIWRIWSDMHSYLIVTITTKAVKLSFN